MKKFMNPFTTREITALQSLLLSDKGVNITPIVNDVCTTETGAEMREIVALKTALLLSGRLPEFEPYCVFTRDWQKIRQWEIIHESLLLGIKDGILRASYAYNKETDEWTEEPKSGEEKTRFGVADGTEFFTTFEEARDSRK